jgi:hypothetical protein
MTCHSVPIPVTHHLPRRPYLVPYPLRHSHLSYLSFSHIILVILLTPYLVIILLISRSTFYSLFPIFLSPNIPALNTALPSMDPIFPFRISC